MFPRRDRCRIAWSEIADRARAAGDARNGFLKITPALFGGEFREIFVGRAIIIAVITPRYRDASYATVGFSARIDRFGRIGATVGGFDQFHFLAGEVQAHFAIGGRGADFGVLVGIVKIIIDAVDVHLDKRVAEPFRERESAGDIGDAVNGGQAGSEDEFRLEPGGAEHGMQQDGAVGGVPVAVGQGGVGGGEFAQRKGGEVRTGETNCFSNVIANGLGGFQFCFRAGGNRGEKLAAIFSRWLERSSMVSFKSFK